MSLADKTPARVAEMLAAMMWAPKSKNCLVEYTGASDSFVDKWVIDMHKSGIIFIDHVERLHKVGRVTHFYKMQPVVPFGLPDNMTEKRP